MTTKRRERYRSANNVMPMESRQITAPIEIRDGGKTNPDAIILQGTPIQYGVPYPVRDAIGEFNETMHPGVVGELATTADCRFLINHTGLPLARTTSGTLTLSDTAKGLQFRAVLDARSQQANDLAVAIERGDVSQMSCGFVVSRDKWDASYENRDIYAFKDLVDVSAVTYPASPTTDISIAERALKGLPQEEQWRVLRVIRDVNAELRAGKAISAKNAERLSKVLDHITKAGGHVQDLLSIDGDGTQGGGSGNGNNNNNPGSMGDDFAGGDAGGDARSRTPIVARPGASAAVKRDADILNLEAEAEGDAYLRHVVQEARAELAREDRELQRIWEAATQRQQLERDLKR